MFYSVLFPNENAASLPLKNTTPPCFQDLNLNQVVEKILEYKKDFNLASLYYTPVTDTETLEYRRSFLRELTDTNLREGISSFSDQLLFIAQLLKETRKDSSGTAVMADLLSQGHMLDYAERYCSAVDRLHLLLEKTSTASSGLSALKQYLNTYTTSEKYISLKTSSASLRSSFSKIEYCMLIKGNTIRVKKYEGQPDYSLHVLQLFDRFRQGDVQDYSQKLSESPYATHVETAVLGLLKELYPEEFEALSLFCREHMSFDDETLLRFAGEVQFYIAWLSAIEPLTAQGLPFCIPESSDAEVDVSESFDLALALKSSGGIVTNSFTLSGPEKLIVITGPNQGGKTTFARMFGQLNYLGSLGLSVPGRKAVLPPCSDVLTLFQREEDITTLNGQLQEELERLKALLSSANSSTAVIINEIFASTTSDDALLLGRKMMGMLSEKNCIGVVVTFLDELSEYNDKTVSMMSVVTETEDRERTFKILRKPADGLAYAINIARNHGLTYKQLKERLI